MRKMVMVILVLVAVVVMGAAMVYGGRGERGGHGGHRLAGLTEEQRAEVHEMVSGMREAGASCEEIHAAVRDLLKSWGIEVPEHPEGERGRHRHKLMEKLTEEQRDAVHALVTEMREAGASRDEIHAAVREMLEGWGIEVPEHLEGERCGHRHGLMEKLTEEQRDAVHTLVTEMREAGASRDEIRAAVRELLESFGIELPEECKGDDAQIQSLISPAEGESTTWGEIKGDFR